ncbi:MAG TPA: Asp-tRNA(Asn)/Glu-tRNA(Gln) amidotransferase subunit GatB [Opitutales bacterium]|jgi:aspartyl-tRNA(Asn)/glutamyl-tRNA(Gln) amidotransferase subunit B|nr:Asp-tRNA(Asn)/Glu-tRNA(Gln) amidotransferase subunit GatB [Opitutales bacterium]
MEFEAVIGLEVHVQIKTRSKMFTRAPYLYGEGPNTLTNPVVLALPGTLPVMNAEAVRKSIKVGLMFNCKIAEVCKWDRKNYFYPDNPKNYQISQYDQPLCLGGGVEIELPGPSRNIMGEHRVVQLTRIHLEEDVGKLTHYLNDSLVDYNRAGVPLLEIVSEPDMHNAEEVFAYLTALRNCLISAGISDCDMEKGQLRCDANVSVRLKGETKLGTKVELKNLNSFSGVKNGVEHEIKRQIQCVQKQERITQETRRWDAQLGVTQSMRSKEQAHDYRYFPDPDLMPVRTTPEQIAKLQKEIPELPFDKQRRYLKDWELPYTITSVICPDRELADYFEAAVAACGNPKAVANYVANDLLRELAAAAPMGESPLTVSQCKITAAALGGLVKLVDGGAISKQIAKDVFLEMFQTGVAAEAIVDAKGLRTQTDTGELEKICAEIIAANPKPVEQYKAGKLTAINALKGQVMKQTKGQANPAAVDEVLKKLLG